MSCCNFASGSESLEDQGRTDDSLRGPEYMRIESGDSGPDGNERRGRVGRVVVGRVAIVTASRTCRQAFVLKLVKTADTVHLSAALFVECPSCRVSVSVVLCLGFVALYPLRFG